VVVGFGFNTANARDSKVRELVRTYLPKARQGDYLRTAMIPVPARGGAREAVQVAVAQPVYVMPAPLPSFRNGAPQIEAVEPAPAPAAVAAVAPAPARIATVAPDAVAVASIAPPAATGRQPAALGAVNALGGAQERPLDVIGAWLSDTFSLGAPPAPLGQTAPSAPLLPPVGIGAQGKAIDLMTSGSTQAPPPAPVPAAAPAQIAAIEPPAGGWVVQIGAAPSETGASTLLDSAAAKVGGLEQFRSYVERFEKNGQVFYRARFSGFEGRDAATTMCNALKRAKMSCLAMQG
jgi:D-alanyl-D-alanine carboxypeptidase